MKHSDTTKKKKKVNTKIRKFYKILALVFAVFFLGGFLLHVILPDKEQSAKEKRMLSRFPAITAGSVFSGHFGDAFEKYASDQMPFRDLFVSLKAFSDSLIGKNESQGVYRGANGFLLEKMDEAEEEKLGETIQAMKAFSEGYASNYAFVLVPNAISIYADKLPAFAPTASQSDFSASVAGQLAGSNIQLLDLTDTLKAAKDSVDPLYYRTDHHWTTQAAYSCLPQVCSVLGVDGAENWTPMLVSDSFVGSLVSKSGFSTRKTDAIYVYKPEQPVNYLVSGSSREGKSATLYSEEGLQSGDPYTVFLGGNDGMLHIETDQAGKGSLLVFKDSYFNCFLPFLLSSYKTIDVVDPRYFCDDLQSLLYQNQYSNVLFFYNMNTFSQDTSLSLVLGELAAGEVTE